MFDASGLSADHVQPLYTRCSNFKADIADKRSDLDKGKEVFVFSSKGMAASDGYAAWNRR